MCETLSPYFNVLDIRFRGLFLWHYSCNRFYKVYYTTFSSSPLIWASDIHRVLLLAQHCYMFTVCLFLLTNSNSSNGLLVWSQYFTSLQAISQSVHCIITHISLSSWGFFKSYFHKWCKNKPNIWPYCVWNASYSLNITFLFIELWYKNNIAWASMLLYWLNISTVVYYEAIGNPSSTDIDTHRSLVSEMKLNSETNFCVC